MSVSLRGDLRRFMIISCWIITERSFK